MDPFTLAILFGTSALASKLGGASTKDALKGAVVNTGINALLPGAGTTGNPFIANVAKATGQDALKMMLVEGAKQGLMQRAGKKFGIDPMLLGIGANFASSYLPQNLQNVGMPNVTPGTNVPTGTPSFDDFATGGVFPGGTGGTDRTIMDRISGVFKTGDEYDIDKIAKGATLFGVPALLYASGAFKPKPQTMYQPTYNINYPELRAERGPGRRINPVTGVEEEIPMVASPEELYGDRTTSPYQFTEKTFYPKEYKTGGLASIQKFYEGGLSKVPTKITHDENDINNYMRMGGYIEDDNGYKNEDTILAQLADGEFITRTDGVLGAGIIAGANPKNEKEMRAKGAKFFYEQQKRFKRIFDLLNENRARKLH
jgi:RNA-splicing ligase RtcB